MTTYTGGNSYYDMMQWNLAAILHGTVISSSPTSIRITGNDNRFYDITGDHLHLNDSHRFIKGTITGFSLSDNTGHTYYTISGFSLDASTFQHYVNVNDVTGFENALFGGDDTITASSTAGDQLAGFAGNDTITGNAGGNALIGGTGNDLLDGRGGNDIVYYNDATGPVTVNLAISGQQTIGGGDGKDTLTSVESVSGSNFADRLIGTSGNNFLLGNGGGDKLDLTAGGTDDARGGDGNDTIDFGAAFNNADKADGEAGFDTVKLTGDYSAGFNLSHIVDVERIILGGGFSYVLKLGEESQNMTIDASALDGAHTLTFDGHTPARSLDITGGAGDDIIYGSNRSDQLHGGNGNDFLSAGGGQDTLTGGYGQDTLTGGGQSDMFLYGSVDGSTSSHYDIITDFTPGQDNIWTINHPGVSAVEPTVNGGVLDQATFDGDLANAIGPTQLRVDGAVLFKPSSGDTGHLTFLVIDDNGVAGYQAGQDFVIALDGVTAISQSDFV